MPADVLTLGAVVFDDYSTPSEMMGGGNQAMVVHKLPGGARVIDTLGPDEANIVWQGEFFANNAYDTCLLLDSMRAAGQVLTLSWGGQSRQVIIDSFIYKVRRLPVWVAYNISCTVYQNPQLGDLTALVPGGEIDNLVSTDLSSAADAAGISPAEALASGTAPL
jgi:hypothetical protein